jgi:NADH-quinone oxidoreductase subunit C
VTEQPPKGEGEAPADAPKEGDAPAATPAHRGPPIVIAEEILNERGETTALLLAKTVGADAVESGGRDDIPWVRVEADRLHDVAERCRDDADLRMDMLHCELAVDWVERIQMIYALYSVANHRRVVLRVDLPADKPEVATVSDLWIAAGWYERETHDLFGVEFPGNPDMSPLLLYEGFEGHPGLKSYPLNDYEEW